MNHENFIEIPPNPSYLIQSLRYIGYTLDTALADIIDNSLSAGASQISVTFRWNSGKPWIAILDNGCGMGEQKLREAMRFGGGASPQESRELSDLGRFGLGLKTASLSQCRQLSVVTKQNNIVSALEWNLDLLRNSTEWSAGVLDETDLRKDAITEGLLDELCTWGSGTVVLWREMDALATEEKKRISENNFTGLMSNASKHVALTFHRFLSPDEPGRKAVKMDFNGTSVEPRNPFGSAIPSRRELTAETFCIEGKRIHIQPFVLPHFTKTSRTEYEKVGGEEGYRDNQGFYIYRNRRLIVKGTWFRLTPKTELTKLLRVRVDIPNSLDHLWQLDVKKSQASPPQIVLERLQEVIQHITNEGRRVYTRRGSRTVSDTVHIWGREIADGKACYTLNEKHPYVKSLVENEKGDIDPQKLALLRIISGAFPVHTFHMDANNDCVEIVSPVKNEEAVQTVIMLIRALREASLDENAIKRQLDKTELALSKEQVVELIETEFSNG